MEVNDMEHLERRIQGHDRRITDAERRLHEMEIREAKRDSDIQIFKMTIDTVESKVSDLKDGMKTVTTAVKEDGEKTRASQDAQQTQLLNIMTRMIDRMDSIDATKESAATREHETKRTKLTAVRDVLISVLALVGAAFTATLTYQELIFSFFK